jgi:hypothetical protein
MATEFKIEDAKKIGAVLGAEKLTFEKDHFRLRIAYPEEKRLMTLEVYPEIDLGKTRGMLIVVYTGNSHLQLHNCTGFLVSEELGEVTFIAETANRLSGLVVERGASCSLYAGLSRELILREVRIESSSIEENRVTTYWLYDRNVPFGKQFSQIAHLLNT